MSDGQAVIDLADRLKVLDEERARVRVALDRAAQSYIDGMRLDERQARTAQLLREGAELRQEIHGWYREQLQALAGSASKLRGAHPADHPYRRASEQFSQLLGALYEVGWTAKALAEASGVSHGAIRARLNSHGYRRDPWRSQFQYGGNRGPVASSRADELDPRH